MKPRLINCLPSFGNAAGGETVTIAGMDIDPAATVDFLPFPDWIPIPAPVTNFIAFPDDLQHITVTTPPIPTLSGIPGDITFIDRKVTIRIYNPPYGEWGELPLGWNARFIDRTLPFNDIGVVLFYPERLQEAIGGDDLFPSFTLGSDLWKQTYVWTSDAGIVSYKAGWPYGGDSTVPYGTPSTRLVEIVNGVPELVRPTYRGPYITRGKIVRVVLESVDAPAGWSAYFYDDANLDAFQGAGAGIGPGPGGAVEFVPVISDAYGESAPVYIDDWMKLYITTAGDVTGKVTVYMALE